MIIESKEDAKVKAVEVDRESQEKVHKIAGSSEGPQEKITEASKEDNNILWPKAAVATTTAIEKAAYESLGSETIQWYIPTYRLVIQDAQVFKRKKWECLILDEAYLIKSWKSQ